MRLLCACYRKDDAHDPELYAAAACAVLSDYPADIVNHVMDPRAGLATKCQWLPTIKEIKDACEALLLENAAAIKRERQVQEQLAERKAIEDGRERTPEQKARIADQIANWEVRKKELAKKWKAA